MNCVLCTVLGLDVGQRSILRCQQSKILAVRWRAGVDCSSTCWLWTSNAWSVLEAMRAFWVRQIVPLWVNFGMARGKVLTKPDTGTFQGFGNCIWCVIVGKLKLGEDHLRVKLKCQRVASPGGQKLLNFWAPFEQIINYFFDVLIKNTFTLGKLNCSNSLEDLHCYPKFKRAEGGTSADIRNQTETYRAIFENSISPP